LLRLTKTSKRPLPEIDELLPPPGDCVLGVPGTPSSSDARTVVPAGVPAPLGLPGEINVTQAAAHATAAASATSRRFVSTKNLPFARLIQRVSATTSPVDDVKVMTCCP
jgi:hypothetical protein